MPTHRFTPIETEAQRAVKRLAGQDLARNRDRQRPKSLQELHQAQLPRDIKADYANTFLRGELEQAITRGRQPTQGFGPLHATPTPTSTPTLAIKPTETREGSADRPEPTRGFFNQIGEGIVGGFEKLGDEVISGVKGFGETNLDMLKGAGKTALQGIEYVDFALTMAFADDETRRKIEERTRELSGGGEDPLAMFKAFKELKEEGRPTVSPEGRVATGQGIVGAFDLTGDVLGGTTLGVVDAIGKHVMGDNFEGIIAKHMAGQNPADPMARVRAYREAKALGEIPLGVQIAVEVPDILLGAPALGAAGAKLAPILGRALKGGARAVAEDVGTLSRNLQPVAERILASERGSVGGPQLPRDLAGAKPRFNLQANSYLPEFESDVDKALYIVAQKMKSKRDADYLAFLKGVFPDLGDAEIRAMGAQVRMAVKDAARIGSPGPINIPPSGFSEGGAAFQTPEVRQALQPPAATGTQTTATGADPSKVDEFKHRVVELGDLRASHQVDFHPNRNYPQAVENAPHPGQATSLGAQAPGKEEVIGRLINERLRDQTRGTLFEGLEGREAAGFREAAPIAPTDAQASRELAGQTGGGPAPKAARPKRVKKEATPEEPPPTSEEELTSLRAADEPGDLPPPPDEPINDGIQRLPPDGDDLVPYESIPPGERLMGDLQDAETAAEIAFSEDFWRKLVNLPYLKGIFGTLNPAAVASNPAKKVMAIRARLRHEGYQKASAAFQSLRRLGSAKEIFGPTDDFGRLTHPDFRGDTLGDVLTHPDRYDLDEIERAWVAEVHKLTDHKLDLLLRNDIDIQLLQFEEGGHFVDRRVWGKMGKNREIVEIKFIAPGPGRPGSKLPGELTAQGDATVKKRWFETEAEGVEAGYAYMDPDEALFLNMQGAYNRIADKNSFEWLIDNVPWRTTGAPEELKLAAFARKQQLNRAKQLKAALNRAVRGERLPPQTIKSIGRSFPREAEELNQLIPLIQKEADTAARVQALDDVADGDILVSQMEFNAATSKRAQARADAMELRLGEARVQAPIFSGKILTGPDAEETAQLINQGLNPQYSSLLADINMVQDVARFMLLTGDYSPATIQLLFLMGSNPVKYRKALAGMVRSTFDEKFIRRYLTENNQVYQRPGSQLIVPIESGTEFTAAAARGGLLQHPVLAPARAILTPFARAFNGAITVAVTEQAKSLDDLRRLSASNMDAVDNFTNEMMGLASSARIGVSPLWRQVESITILASRYNRAIAALLFDVFRGNLRGHLARRALGKGIGAVVAATVAISAATGDDIETIVDRLNPASPNFMTWDVNGQRIGPGSKVRSVMKLLADSMTEPDRLIEFTMENPGLRFVRGNLAPVIRSSLDLLNGRDYLGDKTRDSVLHFFENIVAPNLMPIWVQGTLLEGGDLFQRGTRGAAEFAGFRAYPQSPIAKYISYVEQQTGAKYEDLTRGQRKEFKVEDARGRELWEEFLKDQEARGRDNKTLTMIRGFREDRTTELEEAVDATKAGTITWPELRGRIQETGAAMAAKVEGLENDPSHAGNLEELRQTPDDELPPDEAYRRYNEIIHDPELDQVDGFDFDIRDRRVQEFRNLIGEELWATVMENLRLDRADYPPEVQQYYQDQETVKPYWKVGQDYRLADARVQQIWEQWLDSTQVEKQVLQRKNPGLSAIIARLDAERERMRRQNPEIDVALVRWRGYRPKTREGANLYKTLYVGEEAPQAPGQPSTPRSGLVRPRPPSGEIGKQIEDFIKAQQLTPTPQ